MATILGYIRVSTRGQNIDRQLKKMKELKLLRKNIYIDKQTGTNFLRPAYVKMREHISAGDILYIDSIDRLGRNWTATIAEWNYIVHDIGADIASLTDSESFFDSRLFRSMGDIGKLIESYILTTLAFVADVDRKKKMDYQAEGILAAKERGQKFGRPALPASKILKIEQRLSERLFSLEQLSERTFVSLTDVAVVLRLHRDGTPRDCICKITTLPSAAIDKVLELAHVRRYSYSTIADDVGVSTSSVCNYARKMTGK